MAQTVTITRFNSGFANIPPHYEPGDHDDDSDASVSTARYVLPDGYYAEEYIGGGCAIFRASDDKRAFVHAGYGISAWHPYLVTAESMDRLWRVEE